MAGKHPSASCQDDTVEVFLLLPSHSLANYGGSRNRGMEAHLYSARCMWNITFGFLVSDYRGREVALLSCTPEVALYSLLFNSLLYLAKLFCSYFHYCLCSCGFAWAAPGQLFVAVHAVLTNHTALWCYLGTKMVLLTSWHTSSHTAK